ncbi:MAG: uroporphyrinogen decarboxylase [Planctomycetota bacterium]|nr:MAG: uroporphyrinogen decarboxylase [Planctomycetota bacterium]
MSGADKPLLRALRGQPVERTPIWLMRQAGRALPEYRALKEEHGFVEMTTTPELAAEATLQPVRRFGFDGAILFADILTPLMPLDFGIDFAPGPIFARPLAGPEDLHRVQPPPAGSLDHVAAALSLIRAELPAQTALLGFAGAPFTLAAYLLDGGGSREHARLRAAVYGDPGFLAELLDRLADLTVSYLRLQIEAGAEAIQLFDTWAGLLPLPVYRRTALPAVRKIMRALAGTVPRIYLVKDGAHLLDGMAESGADALSLDWRQPLGAARDRLGPGVAVQGNLDPGCLLGEPAAVRAAARAVLAENAGRPGHVFNLGHGLLPQTPLANIEALCEEVRRHDPAAV